MRTVRIFCTLSRSALQSFHHLHSPQKRNCFPADGLSAFLFQKFAERSDFLFIAELFFRDHVSPVRIAEQVKESLIFSEFIEISIPQGNFFFTSRKNINFNMIIREFIAG